MPVLATLGIAEYIGLAFGEKHVLLERTPRPRDAVLQIADDLVEVDQPTFDQGPQRVLHGRGVAAGAGHQPRFADIVAVELGQAIYGLFLQIGRHMDRAIPFLVGRRIAQAEIGAEVDHLHQTGKIAHEGLAEAMRKGREDEVDLGEINLFDGAEHRKIEMAQLGINAGHGLARLTVGRQGRDPQFGVGGDDPHEFGAGIARGAKYSDVIGHMGLPFGIDLGRIARSRNSTRATQAATNVICRRRNCVARSETLRGSPVVRKALSVPGPTISGRRPR